MTTAESCSYTEDQMLAYVAGELPGDEAAVLAEHMGACRGCRDQAADFAALQTALSECCAKDVVRWDSFETSFGTMYAAATDRGVARITWGQRSADVFVEEMEDRFPAWPVVHDADALDEVVRQLEEYFEGTRSSFDLPVDLSQLSEFERCVLGAARRIPYGEVVAYSELASRIGKRKAARAVGNALGHNPVSIVVPCHRVVRRDGSLGGYGGGLEYKRRLLIIEGRPDLAGAG